MENTNEENMVSRLLEDFPITKDECTDQPYTPEKYKLTDIVAQCDGTTIHQIQAIIDFADVKKGDLGGFVESEDNLSHYGDCWIYDQAKAIGNSKVLDNAQLRGMALLKDHASAGNNSVISESARVLDNATIRDYAAVKGNAFVCDNAKVCGHAKVFGNATVKSETFMSDFAIAYGNAVLTGDAHLLGQASVCGNANVHNGVISDYASVCGNVNIFDSPTLSGKAVVSDKRDYITFHNWWSSGRIITWTRSNDMWKAGCFEGTGEQLVEKAFQDSHMSGREYTRIVNYVEEIKKYL